ncbi:MAG: nitrous oxide reductase accessory protein NosL [Candidatus Marinimicrobia bacterium]|nr:nitrous oxide reductase accessory protein NosL [Candidatus Neomarinimicrobiota bacterium]MCF7850345.1 nitrous oxide reductase accessory protein NosL [Candidatus Neomarinimicrobiota bacterium]MCF7904946.1 nitrous oxide reductase accessory protein NosL [Candidatus Neomarinimicrobiota bacterium]
MRFAVPLIIILLLITLISVMFLSMGDVQEMTVVYPDNMSKDPVEMDREHFQCSECGMVISDLHFAAQIVSADGKTWFFDDLGCMAAWEKGARFDYEPTIWVPDLISGEWIDGRTAWYSRTDTTPMSYGFGAYSVKSEQYVDFESMQKHMLRGETLANPEIRRELLEN